MRLQSHPEQLFIGTTYNVDFGVGVGVGVVGVGVDVDVDVDVDVEEAVHPV